MNMKPIRLLFAAALVLLGLAACDKEDAPVLTPETDITAGFDPDFAKRLQERGIIANATHITYADVADITELDISGEENDWEEGKGLTSLKGIEYFTSLTMLECYWNQLTSLDLSRNTALTELWCEENQLTALDVSKNTSLTELHCYSNQLTALDVSRNTALTCLNCCTNPLTVLDVSRNTALTELYCYSNQLTVLDVSRNTALTELSCVDNRLTVLDLSRNTTLVWLFCNNNQLATLDLSRNTALTLLHCENNPGKEGFFEITRWPGSELKAGMESWEYDGKPVAVKYLGNGE